MTDADAREGARGAVATWVERLAGDVPVQQLAAHRWFVLLAGEKKRTVGLHLSVGERTLIAESHFMRAPDEGAAELYELLLKRNQRSYVLRFAVYDSGDVMIVGVLPLRAVTVEEIDHIAGTLLTLAEETYDSALRLGFAGYIEREQEWRAAVGLPRNPIS